MKNLKTIIALLLVLMLIFTFSACGSKDDSGSEAAPEEQTQETDTENEAEEPQDTSEPADTADDQTSEPAEDENEIIDDEDYDEPIGDGSGLDADEAEDIFDDDGVPNEPEPEEGFTPAESQTSEAAETEPGPYTDVQDLTGDYTGGFKSDTETALNLNVQWAANEGEESDYDVTVRFYVDSYSLFVSERSGNVLKVETESGTKEYKFNTTKVNKEENTASSTMIGEVTIPMSAEDLASGAKVKATWDYLGTYSGKELSEIVAEGEIKSN